MEEQKATAPARKRVNGTVIAGAIAVLFAAFVLVFAITAGTSVSPTQAASDTVPVAAQETTMASGQTSSQVVAAGSAIAASAQDATNEVIDDDENPLGAYPLDNPLDGFVWVVLIGILGAVVFYILSAQHANKDISRMRNSIR
ncbi:MAG: hypothetical protein Q4D27_09790 [Coriobacteriia bacterium]|nr:hypothetical protein [Coriobacteriia bacterium]